MTLSFPAERCPRCGDERSLTRRFCPSCPIEAAEHTAAVCQRCEFQWAERRAEPVA